MSSRATLVLTETIAFLNRAAVAVAEVEDNAWSQVIKLKEMLREAQDELREAQDEMREYRKEADEAQRTLHECKMEWEREILTARLEIKSWRGKCEHFEALYQEQREVTQSAYRETEQWKTSYRREEEARQRDNEELLQQLASWKDQYWQAEKDRQRQQLKLEAALANLNAPSDGAVNNKILRSLLMDTSNTIVEEPDRYVLNYRNRGASHDGPAEVVLLRRVHAIVNLPVKEEEGDEASLGTASSPVASSDAFPPAPFRTFAPVSALAHRQASGSLPSPPPIDSAPVLIPIAPSSGTSTTAAEEAPRVVRKTVRRPIAHTISKSVRVVRQTPWISSDLRTAASSTYDESATAAEDDDLALVPKSSKDSSDGTVVSQTPKKVKIPRTVGKTTTSPTEEQEDELAIGHEANHKELYGASKVQERAAARAQAKNIAAKVAAASILGTKRKTPDDEPVECLLTHKRRLIDV